jgi:hypothetical protein
MVLNNDDNALRPNSQGGLWYDKVIKTFRGVRYAMPNTPPKVAIVYEGVLDSSLELKSILQQMGFSNVTIKLEATTVEELRDYEIIISHGGTVAAGKAALMESLYEAGKKVMTTGDASTATEVPLIVTTSGSGTKAYGIDQVAYDTPVSSGWTAESQGSATGVIVTAVRTTARVVARYLDGATEHYTGIIEEDLTTGGRWFHYQPDSFGTQAKILLANALTWLWNYEPYREWSAQIGEFVVDDLREANFPHHVSITGRDYAKKCMTSKLEYTISFAAGTPLTTLIMGVAGNAGISKFNLPETSVTLSERIDFERGTERWRVISLAANSNNFELYFDSQGYLTMREYLDPALSPISQSFSTGLGGNLVSWTRSVNDSRLYNHIIVTGENPEGGEGDDQLPFYGEAVNNEPSSPTRVSRIGDRSYFYTSSFFTSDQQCIDLARSWLKIHALESYELDWSSLVYPWLEVGEIAEFLDPNRLESDPTRFLLDTLSIPLDLGPMSATGKRVTFVEDSSLVGAP